MLVSSFYDTPFESYYQNKCVRYFWDTLYSVPATLYKQYGEHPNYRLLTQHNTFSICIDFWLQGIQGMSVQPNAYM